MIRVTVKFEEFGGFEKFVSVGNIRSRALPLSHSSSPPPFFQRNVKYFFINLNLINTNHL